MKYTIGVDYGTKSCRAIVMDIADGRALGVDECGYAVYDETLEFCLLDERMTPCIDFAHLHALTGGGLKAEEDFVRILDRLEEVLGLERARRLHMHFSTIEYTAAGEKRHHTFAEPEYGPRFEMLAPHLAQRGYHGTVICECKGTQADDAAQMQRVYRAFCG